LSGENDARGADRTLGRKAVRLVGATFAHVRAMQPEDPRVDACQEATARKSEGIKTC
jgi:hypothetical protein